MAAHERFAFRSRDDLLARARDLNLALPFADNVEPLVGTVRVAGRTLANRFAVLPMEGADGDGDGAPSELTARRYRRFAAGGSGLIWFEATAVAGVGRSNPHQLWISGRTLDAFKRMVEATRTAGRGTTGRDPLLVLQLTHSGRFAKPEGKPRPVIAQHSPHLDPLHGLPADYPLITDEELDRLQDDFVRAAELAAAAGFDGVDVKSCHGYLISELLASHTRLGSRHGGAFENRSRFLLQTVRRIKDKVAGLIMTSRLSATDLVPYPYGFGMDPKRPESIDLGEVKALAGALAGLGTPLLLTSLGIPFWKPFYGRPFDIPVPGAGVPGEHPLEGVARHLAITAELQRGFPNLAVIGPGYSWLRQYFPHVAAASVRAGNATLIGQGRGAFAYPDFARDLAERGSLNVHRVCTSCSRCSQLLREGRPAGCVVRDNEVYRVP
ncbi:MAG: hypothetical protein OEW05_09530 [Candidatus Aminicenantes bacterium]|nr:hypothetical protein [Candidatus Aminicenantes bacterium]